MADVAKKAGTYEDLCSLPDNMIGEIINGEIIATPRPSLEHAGAASVLAMELGPSYQFGRGGGPGCWWILLEPEIHVGEHVLVPDLAGWRVERMPSRPRGTWATLPPDWVCEILSPKTFRLDRVRKMPIYAEFQVPYVWVLDPANKALEVFRLESGKWVLVATYVEDDKVRAEPFQEVEIELKSLWAD